MQGLNCTWDPYQTQTYPNGTTVQGSCYDDWTDDSSGWGGMSSGCWQHDAYEETCTNAANSAKCEWEPNDINQNPYCHIKSLADAQDMNSDATAADIGCCDMKGCWSYDGNETLCNVNVAFEGLCHWVNTSDDSWCPDPQGCCYTKWCGEIYDEGNCTKAKTDLFMACTWDTDTCVEDSGGGYATYNDTDSCMSQGGWWNSDGECVMPTDDGGGGGFMFGGDAHCWFADNKPEVCGNITGCVYCDDADSETNNITSACFRNPLGFCQGHEPVYTNNNGTDQADVTGIAFDNLNCSHIQIKSACTYGPLPNCRWTNSTAILGAFCDAGKDTTQKTAPPVPYCEHPDSKNNESMCSDLSSKYMMPCLWYNTSTNLGSGKVAINCSFNSNAVFGINEEKEFEVISSEGTCVAAMGTWIEEFYIEDGALKQDAWCEKSNMYDFATGQSLSNSGNCDVDCWACEFNSTGGNYGGDVDVAEAACIGSAAGYCRWSNDTNAQNDLGFCDYPQEMSYGAGDCQASCKDCGMLQNPYDSCVGSAAGCVWSNDTDATGNKLATGVCVANSKKICDGDCYSCYSIVGCNTSITSCAWENSMCVPATSESLEYCFNGLDDDGDSLVDCSDPDCSFDTSCGGGSFANCAQYTDDATCNETVAFDNYNCTWITFPWDNEGRCRMPGENCMLYDGDMDACGDQPGCNNDSDTRVHGGGSFCDMNMTIMDSVNCWQYNDNATTTGCEDGSSGVCLWRQDDWGGSWCDHSIFAACMDSESEALCSANSNCTWRVEEWSGDGGFCDIACFNYSLDETTCGTLSDSLEGLCEWRDTSTMCTPTMFEVMSGSMGGKMGCAQYDGNETACLALNVTCVWQVDTNVVNSVGGSEPDGWCNSKGMQDLMGDMHGEPVMLGFDAIGEGMPTYVDIVGMGIRISDNAYGFGLGIVNLTDAAYCFGYPLSSEFSGAAGLTGSGQNTTKFKWYLDVSGCWEEQGDATQDCGVDSPACTATDENGQAYDGFEFYISHVTGNNSDTENLETSKQLYRCVRNSTSEYTWQWSPTNVFVSEDKKFTCYSSGVGAAFVSVEKEALENFPEFNMTAPIAILAVSSDGSDSNMDDSVGPNYYTPGTVDFDFVDCSNPDTKDPKCKSFQKFGFQMFEDCKNTIDDDGDGLADCDDPKCIFTPACASGTAFNWGSGTDDYKTPIVMFSKVDRMADAAVVMFDTDEPANGTLNFYHNSSTCATLNTSIADVGDANFDYDDYKPFHRILLESDNLGYDLVVSTSYFYKVQVCDPFNNCGTSKCLNFTTRAENKPFIFRMNLPEGFSVDIPAMDLTDENFTRTVNGQLYEVGFKTNSTVTRNMNVTIKYGNLALKLVGVDIYKPKTLNLENAFIVDEVNNVLGMNSSSKAWHMLISDLGLGGFGDYLELEFNVAYDADNTIYWYDDTISTGEDVSDYTECAGSTTTLCKIPTSLGFSAYKITVADDSTTPAATTGSGSGSGGGGTATNTTDDEDEADDEDDEEEEEEYAPVTAAATAEKKKTLSLPSFDFGEAGDRGMLISVGVGIVLLVVALLLLGKYGKPSFKGKHRSYTPKSTSFRSSSSVAKRRRLSSVLSSFRTRAPRRRSRRPASKGSFEDYGFRIKK